MCETEISQLTSLVERMQEEIYDLKDRVNNQEYELTILRNEIELVKNEGCWLSKQNSNGGCHE